MRRPIVTVCCLWMLFALTLTGPLDAASLYWDAPANGTLTVELGGSATGPFSAGIVAHSKRPGADSSA